MMHSNLERYVSDFLASAGPLLNGRPTYFKRAFPASDVNDWISFSDLGHWLATPAFLQKQTVVLRSKDVAKNKQVRTPGEFHTAAGSGMTLQVRNLESFLSPSSPLTQVARSIEKFIGHPLESATLFVTPPASQGLPRHSDEFEVFVLQISGRKIWNFDDEKLVLEGGDIAYIPTGAPHEVISAEEESSVSVSFLFRPLRVTDILESWLSEIEQTDAILPPRSQTLKVETLVNELSFRLRRLVSSPNFSSRLELHFSKAILSRLPAPSLDIISSPDIGIESMLQLKEELFVVVDKSADHVELLVGGDAILKMPFYVEPEITAVLSAKGPFSASHVAVNLSLEDTCKLLSKLVKLGVVRRVCEEKAEAAE